MIDRLLLLAFLCACTGPQDVAPVESADLILTNGRIKAANNWVEAISIIDGRIAAVGDAALIAQQAGDTTKLIDLDGGVVLPGFHDLHVHPVYGGIMYSGRDHTNCKIEQGSTLQALLGSLTDCVTAVAETEWVAGGQWDASALGRAPHRSILDSVSHATPVLLNDTSGHSAWANSAALKIAGIDRNTPDPEAGIIERDKDGIPTGVLRESAIGLVRSFMPAPSDDTIRESLAWSLQTMLSFGITSYTEASNGFVGGPLREIDAYRTLAEAGRLKQRVRVCLNWLPDNWTPDGESADELLARRAQFETDRLTFDCVKIFLDGVPTDSHTAAMLAAYAGAVNGRDDDASRYGMLLLEQSVTNDAVTRFDKEGITVKFHAAGDAAVRSGLDAIEAARNANGMSALRHNVGHCTFIAREDLARAKALNATLELSPYLWSPSPINDDITLAIGDERIARVWPFREAIDSGALVVPGSDWSVVPSVNPWTAIEALVTREVAGGSEKSFGKSQAISVAEAIDLFTVNSARHMGRENDLGEIAPGMLADLVVIDQDPFEVAATKLHRTRVLMTFIDGEKVYDSRE